MPGDALTWGARASVGMLLTPKAGIFCLQHQLIEAETNGRHFADDIFKSIFLNENIWTPIKISLKFVPKGLINNIPALVKIMAWRRPGDKPLSEPMMVSLLTHICVTRPQWVKNPEHPILQQKSSFVEISKTTTAIQSNLIALTPQTSSINYRLT